MKIFIGGMKPHHQRAFEREFPDVEFEFAAYTDADRVWVNNAKGCDVVIVDQSRCTHKLMDRLRLALNAPLHLTDSKQRIRSLIKEVTEHGTTAHHFAH